jgi:hypothetical protein
MLIFTNKTCAICSLFLVFVHPAQTKRFVFVEAVVQGNFAFILWRDKNWPRHESTSRKVIFEWAKQF